MMQRLAFRSNAVDFEWRGDVDTIVRICAEHGYEISPADARLAWQDFSDMMCATWMSLGDADHTLTVILNRCDVLPSDSEAK